MTRFPLEEASTLIPCWVADIFTMETIRLRTIKLSLTLGLLLLSSICAAADHAAAQKVVDQLHEALQNAMAGGAKLSYTGRVELLRPVIESSFDFESIARIVTGRYWKEASADQRAGFIDTFKQLSVASYATNFRESGGEKFSILGIEADHETLVVRAQLAKPKGEPISFNYALRQTDGRWLIVNVIAQGVSDLALKRADYAAVIKAEGFASLIDRLQKKVAEMSHSS